MEKCGIKFIDKTTYMNYHNENRMCLYYLIEI